MRRATIALDQIEPGIAPLVIADPDLTLPGKLALLYVLSHPHQLHGRQELADVDQLVADHLDEVLHELVGRNWLATVPPDAPPCLAARFQLREDHNPDQDQDQTAPDGHLHAGLGGGNGGDGGLDTSGTYLGAGVTWVAGGSGSDGSG
jgi:hypothetical protein